MIMVDIVCDIDALMEQLNRAKEKNQYIWIEPRGTYHQWRENHQLCVHNYELMKDSRKRIIRQRDNLLRENERLKKQIGTLKGYSKLKEENNSLYYSLRKQTEEIVELKRLLEQRRDEDFEYRRRYNLIRQVVDGQVIYPYKE